MQIYGQAAMRIAQLIVFVGERNNTLTLVEAQDMGVRALIMHMSACFAIEAVLLGGAIPDGVVWVALVAETASVGDGDRFVVRPVTWHVTLRLSVLLDLRESAV
jgi:hypothetical protein